MVHLETMEIAPGVAVQVEVSERLAPRVREVAASKDTKNRLYEALDAIEAFGRTASERLKKLAEAAGPDEVTIEIGVGVSSEAGVIFASASADANLKVTLTWKQREVALG